MHRTASQLTVSLVAVVLGLLVVVQLRAQGTGTGLEALSAQDLTLLVANLNTRNDQLRTEVAGLDRELRDLSLGEARGDSAMRQIQSDLSRVRAWSGLVAVRGPGIRITVDGRIAGPGVEDLLNELRNAGAEAIAVADVRVVPGTVVAGPPDGISVDNVALGEQFEVTAIGQPETLTASLTRIGGIVAQLAATYPDVTVTVTPVDRLVVPAATRSLVPSHGTPRL
jgi:uncharacterized protein YlxW (UPF0749 family)